MNSEVRIEERHKEKIVTGKRPKIPSAELPPSDIDITVPRWSKEVCLFQLIDTTSREKNKVYI